MLFAIYNDQMIADFSILDSLLVSLIAIVIVFIVLTIIIFITGGFSKTIELYDSKTKINPRPENSILETDEDAVVAALVATIDFNKTTGKSARLVSIERLDD